MPETEMRWKVSDPTLMALCNVLEQMGTESDYESREALCRKGVLLLLEAERKLDAALQAQAA